MSPLSRRFAWIAIASLAVAIGILAMRRPDLARTATHRVTIENMKFSPEEIEISLGDQVEFVNSDLLPHTATAVTGQMFDSETLQSGQTWKFVPQREGIINYNCKFHPVMEGRIVVHPQD